MKYSKILLLLALAMPVSLSAQVRSNKKNGGYQFTFDKEILTSTVKNQFKSSTCWAFSTQSFLESELMRMGKGPVDLSEMFVVHNAYVMKAQNYVRMQGNAQFAPGGEPHDVMHVLKEKGMVPQEVYQGLSGTDKPTHNELDKVLKAMLDVVITMPNGKLSNEWLNAYEGAVNGYLGAIPEKFEYRGKQYTPRSFADSLGINPDDYIEITSFTHHPYYEQFVLEVPDNWNWEKAYNVPLDELEQIVDSALLHNYSVEWASDVSEKSFSFKNGVAVVPLKSWEEMDAAEQQQALNAPLPERMIDAESRQEGFDNQTTQDDHGMHMVGLAHDQTGKKFYLIKNSWGTEGNDLQGYFYCSTPYFRYKTTCIMVNKHALPKAIAKKLNIKIS